MPPDLEHMLVQAGKHFQDKCRVASLPLLHTRMLVRGSLSCKMADQALPLLVIVTGAPGSGKTTIARALAVELRLPLLAKDDIKEALFDALGTGDREQSRTLGRATYEVLFAVARRLLDSGVSCIIESNFSNAEPLRSLSPARIVQIFCTAPVDVILERYSLRPRHPGHLDAEIVAELRERLATDEWRPLDLDGMLIEVDTTMHVDAKSLAATVSG
jgi:predicted kinase